jgi:hypothetical protein
MSEAPVSFFNAANLDTEIGVQLFIQLAQGTIKLDLALPKDAPETQAFMNAANVLYEDRESRIPGSTAIDARTNDVLGIDLTVHSGICVTALNRAVLRESPAPRKFMDAVAVLIGLKQAA